MRWGVVATVKASERDVLNFVAHHLCLGAHRVFVYLDAPAPGLAQMLRAHPKVRAFETSARGWVASGRRPVRHQKRQEHNAQHAYRKAGDLDWLAHIDVDEFLCPDRPIDHILRSVEPHITTARVSPIEALAEAPGLFKACHRAPRARHAAAMRLYPTYGAFLPGGFLSHVAGKTFVRTGLPDVEMRIHGIHRNGQRNPQEQRLADITLAHFHAADWTAWRKHFSYRHTHGSYRAELPGIGGQNRHALFAALVRERGDAGLRHLFDEVALGTDRHIEALRAEGLLRNCDLKLDTSRRAQFPLSEGAAARRIDSAPLYQLKGARVL